MDTDLALVLGLVLGVFSVSGLVSAYSENRLSRASLLVLAAAIGLMAYAVFSRPGGYTLDELPDVIMGVVARFWP